MPNNSKEAKLKAFSELLDIMDELREKCPWDKKQTFDTIRPLTIEETYELSEAILEKDFEKIKKELGDLLLHIVFYSKMGDEQQKFDIKDVIEALNEKLIFRHPHVFGETKVKDEKEVRENWENLKLKEKDNKRVLGGLPKSLPPVLKAYRMTEKVANVGFDWEKKEDIWQKLDEELKELAEEVKNGDKKKMEDELGDVLFVLINAARLYGLNPDTALEKANQKFMRRFNYIEDKLKEKGLSWKQVNLKTMDQLWNEAKKLENETEN